MDRPPTGLESLREQVVTCRACPRLVAWREEVARRKRRAFREEDYWGRPVPGWGDPQARLLVVGLAPAAHGANRTGRMFTGDRSGEWLYRALFHAGFASAPRSLAAGDDLRLRDCYVTAALRCAPPGNRPAGQELRNCRPFLERELELLGQVRVIVALGRVAFAQVRLILASRGAVLPEPFPAFRHGLRIPLEEGRVLLASYHPSQQNTFTGRLTEDMFRKVWDEARELVGAAPLPPAGQEGPVPPKGARSRGQAPPPPPAPAAPG